MLTLSTYSVSTKFLRQPSRSNRWLLRGSSSRGLALVCEHGKSWVVCQLLVQLLEFLERVLVVLTGTLRQDVHFEVGIGNLLFVVLLVWGGELVSLTLEFLICLLEVLLFLVQTALDDGCAGQ